MFGDVDVYHPPQDKRLRGYLRDLVKGRLPVPPGLDVGSIRVVKLREDMQYGWKMVSPASFYTYRKNIGLTVI